MAGIIAEPSTTLAFQGSAGSIVAKYYDAFSGGCGVLEENVTVDNDLIFVGYGITAPDQKWDDFKGTDVRGKILLVLVNDPPSDDPTVFGGKAMTYYGRWIYKFEEAARRGAAGAILIHMTDKAGYPWQVVQKSWSGERFQLEERPDPLLLEGWIRGEIAESLLKSAGKDFATLVADAGRSDFKPVPLGIRVKAQIKNKIRKLTAPNVAGILTGTKQPDQYICLVAHHDHFGIGTPDEKGDRIYNGALDNATGVAVVIELARALSLQKPADSIIFLTVTAEEQGLLGSLYYTMHPLVPLEKTTTAISLDAINVLGRTEDVQALGAEQSQLDSIILDVANSLGLKVTPDRFPERGGFFRSDHFSFARAGVPGISINGGSDYVGKPKGWGEQKRIDFINKHYHQPSDEITPEWDTSGLVQVSDFMLKLVARLGEEKGLIPWKKESEYQRVPSLK